MSAGCSQVAQAPYDQINPSFNFKPIPIPQDWEVLVIEEYFDKKKPTNLLNIQYEENPSEIMIVYGIPGVSPDFAKTKDMEEYNKKQEEQNSNRRAKFMQAGEALGIVYIRKYDEPIEFKEAISDFLTENR